MPTAGSLRTGTSELSLVCDTRRGIAAAATPRIMVKTIHVTRVRVNVAAIDSVAMTDSFRTETRALKGPRYNKDDIA
jgi:hypothetical protein